jgi:hypothetical protein
MNKEILKLANELDRQMKQVSEAIQRVEAGTTVDLRHFKYMKKEIIEMFNAKQNELEEKFKEL